MSNDRSLVSTMAPLAGWAWAGTWFGSFIMVALWGGGVVSDWLGFLSLGYLVSLIVMVLVITSFNVHQAELRREAEERVEEADEKARENLGVQ